MELNAQSSHTADQQDQAVEGSDPDSWENDPKAKDKSLALQKLILEKLDDDKAEDIIKIDLDGKSDVADAMIIASGRSQRHVGALADHIAREMKDKGFGSPSIEGMPACDWVLLDSGDVIVHLFRPEVREFYNIEKIWSPEAFKEPKPAAN